MFSTTLFTYLHRPPAAHYARSRISPPDAIHIIEIATNRSAGITRKASDAFRPKMRCAYERVFRASVYAALHVGSVPERRTADGRVRPRHSNRTHTLSAHHMSAHQRTRTLACPNMRLLTKATDYK